MKYRLLTKEQFEVLHKEFAHFLASQQIDAKEWAALKKNQPNVATQELQVFSDVVWDEVLTKARYLEHFSKKTINLFYCDLQVMKRIVIQVEKEIDLTQNHEYQWLVSNPTHEAVQYLSGTKNYLKERNLEIFELIEKGSQLSNGKLFLHFSKLIDQ